MTQGPDRAGRRSSRWRRDGAKYTIAAWATTHLDWFWHQANRPGLLQSLVNEGIINRFVASMEPRPTRLSTLAGYTSWSSLTDRRYSDRHLPPAPAREQLPDIDEVARLFRRPEGSPRLSKRSSLLFPFFAQWFVDGFLRTDPSDPLKNTSGHEIDLSQLYGPVREHTDELRSHEDGRLKCEERQGQVYPPRLYEGDRPKHEFKRLAMAYPGSTGRAASKADRKGPDTAADEGDPVRLPADRQADLLALGLPRGNLHYGLALMSTIFLREHNRLAGLIGGEHPGWDDERLFQTTRNVLIVMLLKVVIQDYINHITPFKFKLICEPGIGLDRPWFRTNWMSIEFDLLYRWHTLVPDEVTVVRGTRRAFHDLLWDLKPLAEHDPADLIDQASRQPCGCIGLLNTSPFMAWEQDGEVKGVDKTAIEIGRCAELASFNDYRQACGYPRLRSIADVSSCRKVQQALLDCYGDVDRIELYVGLFAEDIVEGGMLPTLMSTMVGVDAFSQALTNPLLDPRLFNAQTFSEVGMAEIEKTERLQDIVHRNVTGRRPAVSFDLLVEP